MFFELDLFGNLHNFVFIVLHFISPCYLMATIRWRLHLLRIRRYRRIWGRTRIAHWLFATITWAWWFRRWLRLRVRIFLIFLFFDLKIHILFICSDLKELKVSDWLLDDQPSLLPLRQFFKLMLILGYLNLLFKQVLLSFVFILPLVVGYFLNLML